MDKSDEYLRKCTEAKAIQEMWEPKDGDFFVSLKSERPRCKVCVLGDWETRSHIAENRDAFIWLPRLDQLQSMVDWTHWEFRITKRRKFEMHYTDSSGTTVGSVLGESMEQIWIAFVMMVKYGKEWKEERAQWERGEASPLSA